MKPFAYISKDGVLFKELPPSPWFELTPLYAMRELTDEEIKKVYGQYFDVKNFDWLHLQFIRDILGEAREK
tara:strand:- start:5391 stop:5603 length:213 start_codon:yes stop_codon:yes gene_type:complete